MASANYNLSGKNRIRIGTVGMILLGVVVPFTGITVIRLFFTGLRWYNESLHSLMESLGVLAALLLAALLLLLRKKNRDLDHHIWIICGLLSMGILDGIHSAQTSEVPFLELRCLSTLLGGFLFSLVWLPERGSRSRTADLLPLVTVVAATTLGLLLAANPWLIPAETETEGYTIAVKATNTVGGVLFFVASAYFVRRFRAWGGFDDFLFASLCLLFGMSGIMFSFSMLWSIDWWFWHVMRSFAFLHILFYMFFIYQQTLSELKGFNELLEQRVKERTAELSAEIAERIEAEESLKESRFRYRRLVESVTDYIYSVRLEDGQPVATSHSPGCVTVTGYAAEEYAADPGLWYRMIHEEDRPVVLEQASLVLSGTGVPTVEHRIIHKDGRVRWVKNTPVPCSDPEGHLVSYDGLISDITERKMAEEEIKTFNEELLTINRVVTACTNIIDLREILDKILDEITRIVGLDEGSICLRGSDGALTMVSRRGPPEAVALDVSTIGQKVGTCFFGACAGNFRPLILPDRESVHQFAEGGAIHGEGISFHAAFPLITGARNCVGVLCVFTRGDRKPSGRSLRLVETITAHMALFIENARLYEETLSHAATLERKVAERTLELEEANRKLREIDRTKSMFIASMSHELRTPLNSVIGFSSILLDEWVGPLNDEQKDNLSKVLKAGELLLSLINDVIDVSKIEAGQIEISREEFDLHDVVREAVSTVEKEIDRKGLGLRVENIHCMLNTARRRLLQCLLNLLNNAAKYTESGTISVGVRRLAEHPSGDFVEISVEDTGIGIRPEDEARIFEPFARLDSPLRSRVSGTGLGLYLTRKLVMEVLGGKITLSSEYGKGSRFVMTIPTHGME